MKQWCKCIGRTLECSDTQTKYESQLVWSGLMVTHRQQLQIMSVTYRISYTFCNSSYVFLAVCLSVYLFCVDDCLAKNKHW